jgi:hypothetical protein
MDLIRVPGRRRKGLAALTLGLSGLLAAALTVTAAPAFASTPATPAGKPPPPAAGLPVTPHRLPPILRTAPKKPASHQLAQADCFLFVFGGLTASSNTVPVGSNVTLTASASCDVGPTPDWLEIFDTSTGARVAVCGSGFSCSAQVSQSVATTHGYVGYLGAFTSTLPSSTPMQYVTWEAGNTFTVSLSGPLFAGSGATYTATTNQDVGPTPYWIEIFNQTTGALLRTCPFGTSCSVNFTPSPSASANLVAFVSFNNSALPPSGTQASSNILATLAENPPG